LHRTYQGRVLFVPIRFEVQVRGHTAEFFVSGALMNFIMNWL